MHDSFILEAIQFAKEKNPIWPFATILVNHEQKIILKAADCAHISPLYHSESLAIHTLITENLYQYCKEIQLYSTAACDPLSFAAVYWATITHDLVITHIYYGLSVNDLNKYWKFGFDIELESLTKIARSYQIKIHGGIAKSKCIDLFDNAIKIQNSIQNKHPGRRLSKNYKDFVEINKAFVT